LASNVGAGLSEEERAVNRKVVAVGITCVLAVSVTAIVLVIDPFGASFHFEWRDKAVGTGVVQFTLGKLRDSQLSISFVNDTSLLYSLDVTLFSPAFMNSVFTFISHPSNPDYAILDFEASAPTRSVNLVLGTARGYFLTITGTNLTSSVKYGNGSLLTAKAADWVDPSTLWYDASGTLGFEFQNDVNFTTRGLDVQIGFHGQKPDSVNVNVVLPSGLRGSFYYYSQTSISIALGGMWMQYTGFCKTYMGDSEPTLHMSVRSSVITAVLT